MRLNRGGDASGRSGRWLVRAAWGAALAALLSCSRGTPDPVAPEAVGALHRLANPPKADAAWSFVQSVDSWDAAYADPSGQIGLRIYAFQFPDADAAESTYEASRREVLNGGGNYTHASARRVHGQMGLRLSDAKGESFQFQRGAWLIVLEGPADGAFPDAVAALFQRPASP